jgi:hypothetical protein
MITKVFINCLQHKHSLCFGRSTQCPQEQQFLSIASSSSLLVDSSLVFPDFTAVCDVGVAILLYSYIDSIRNLFVIMSSSDIDFEVGENSCFGYQYEPEYLVKKFYYIPWG